MRKKIAGLVLCLCLVMVTVGGCVVRDESVAVVEQAGELAGYDCKFCVVAKQPDMTDKYVEYLCTSFGGYRGSYYIISNYYVRYEVSGGWLYRRTSKYIPGHTVVEIQVKDQNGIWR